MNINTITITSTATSVLSKNTSQKKRRLINDGIEDLFIGDTSTIATSTAFPIKPSETLDISDYNGSIYGICSSSSLLTYLEDE